MILLHNYARDKMHGECAALRKYEIWKYKWGDVGQSKVYVYCYHWNTDYFSTALKSFICCHVIAWHTEHLSHLKPFIVTFCVQWKRMIKWKKKRILDALSIEGSMQKVTRSSSSIHFTLGVNVAASKLDSQWYKQKLTGWKELYESPYLKKKHLFPGCL